MGYQIRLDESIQNYCARLRERLQEADDLLEYIDYERSHMSTCSARLSNPWHEKCTCMDRRFYNEDIVTDKVTNYFIKYPRN